MVDLSHLKRRPIESRSVAMTNQVTEQDAYLAFNPKDSVVRLQIRPANGPTWSPYYMNLQAVAYDGDFGTNFVLMFGIITVRVRGQNLCPMITALEMGTAAFIQEFDSDRWTKPGPNEPLIEWMEIEQHGPKSESNEPSRSSSRPH